MIRLAPLALLSAALFAKDDQRLALLRQAQDSFDRVEKAASVIDDGSALGVLEDLVRVSQESART